MHQHRDPRAVALQVGQCTAVLAHRGRVAVRVDEPPAVREQVRGVGGRVVQRPRQYLAQPFRFRRARAELDDHPAVTTRPGIRAPGAARPRSARPWR